MIHQTRQDEYDVRTVGCTMSREKERPRCSIVVVLFTEEYTYAMPLV